LKHPNEERPTILMFDSLPTLLTQYIVDIQKFRMTGIRHAVVTHKDNIYNVGKIAGH
jgi:hypothetical protein